MEVTQQTQCEMSYAQRPDAGNPVSQKLLQSGRANQMSLANQSQKKYRMMAKPDYPLPLFCVKNGNPLKGDSVLHENRKWFIKCWAMPHCLFCIQTLRLSLERSSFEIMTRVYFYNQHTHTESVHWLDERVTNLEVHLPTVKLTRFSEQNMSFNYNKFCEWPS